MKISWAIAVLAAGLTGCATWSTGNVDRTTADAAIAAKTPVDKILVTESDVVDRKYRSLGDISVTVNKTTIFHPNPTPELVNQALKAKASELGADAVILVRYGQVGVGVLSWGSLDGKGRAIKFTP